MPYKYFPITTTSASTVTDALRQDFQAMLDAQFYEATNVYTIQEEYVFGSGSYVNLDVRIKAAINTETGEKKGDDFKVLSFKTITYPVGLGRKYFFDGNYWLCVFTERYKNLASSFINILSWLLFEFSIFSLCSIS